MKNTVYARAFVAADIIAKTLNLAFRVSDLLEISSDGDSIVIRKVTCALCGRTENIRQYLKGVWVCDSCAEAIAKGMVRDSKFVDSPGVYAFNGRNVADQAAASSDAGEAGASTVQPKRGSYSDYAKEFEQGDGDGG